MTTPNQPPVNPGYPQQQWTPPAGYAPPTYTQPAPPAKPRGGLRLAAFLFAAASLILLGTVAIAVGSRTGSPVTDEPTGGKSARHAVAALTQAGAERACRTAFNREWEARSERATSGKDTTIIATVQNIELLETWKTDTGYSVNGTIHYTMSTGIIAPVEDTIDLTCSVSGSDGSPTTTVDNRN